MWVIIERDSSMQAAGCRLQAAGCRLQAADSRLQGAGCRVQAAWCRLQAAGTHSLTSFFTARYLCALLAKQDLTINLVVAIKSPHHYIIHINTDNPTS